MNHKSITVLLILLSIPCTAHSQVFGQFSTATIASEGEGGLFLAGGSDAFRTGIMGRFKLTPNSGLGLQLGYYREYGVNSTGVGVDYKRYIINIPPVIPIDISADASAGYLGSEDFGRYIFSIGALASGRFTLIEAAPVEPYCSLIYRYSHFSRKGSCAGYDTDWPCAEEKDKGYTRTLLRAGMKIFYRDDFQFLLEVEIDGGTVFGGGVNIIF